MVKTAKQLHYFSFHHSRAGSKLINTDTVINYAQTGGVGHDVITRTTLRNLIEFQ